ncbi:MAG: diguanylate cyclase domain-containing protein [Myxococcaceae bacterium]
MSMVIEGTHKRILMLEGAIGSDQLAAALARLKLSVQVETVDGPLPAATALAENGPHLLIVDADAAWQRALVTSLPTKRPAVLMVGGPSALAAGPEVGGDEWATRTASPEELAFRMGSALFRAKERRRADRRLFADTLTGLPNRRALVSALVRDSSRARRVGGAVCLVLLDLDEFKQVNETLGHPEGDRLLRRVGAAIRRTVREDEVCGRIGGDEFAFVVSGRRDEAEALIERVNHSLRALGVSASAAACQLGHAERLRDLYRRTDELLNRRKQQSRAKRPLTHGEGSAGYQSLPQ